MRIFRVETFQISSQILNSVIKSKICLNFKFKVEAHTYYFDLYFWFSSKRFALKIFYNLNKHSKQICIVHLKRMYENVWI